MQNLIQDTNRDGGIFIGRTKNTLKKPFSLNEEKERDMKKNKAFCPLIAAGILILAVFLLYPFLSAKTVDIQEPKESETCAECHDELAEAIRFRPHAASSCTACHSDPTKHLEEGGGPNIFVFGAEETSLAKSGRCLICRTGMMARYFAGPHAQSSLNLILLKKSEPFDIIDKAKINGCPN